MIKKTTETGARWADLLRLEAHVGATRRDAGIAGVPSEALEREGRVFLDIFSFQAEDGIRDIHSLLEFRRVLFRSGSASRYASAGLLVYRDSPKLGAPD